MIITSTLDEQKSHKSTNVVSKPAYQPYNKYGPGYWLEELSMDCSRNEHGWLEVKGFLAPNGGWLLQRHRYFSAIPEYLPHREVWRSECVPVGIKRLLHRHFESIEEPFSELHKFLGLID
ncbi:hypothetical protein OESDEN_01089 [Oesophagostomum dentatum]|uniref:Uncharacterized protein n=1 Tax=Oesophagostomum dentatum TaxID=61180 RepID=A0A0B1TNS4_OESDE|nr:hypothetical protein OESDEN_01089 [Oesophagostomum dentatum]